MLAYILAAALILVFSISIWFSLKKLSIKSRISDQDKAILSLKLTTNVLKQNHKKIQYQMASEYKTVVALVKTGEKSRAKIHANKIQFYKQNLERINGQLKTISQLIHKYERWAKSSIY